MGEIIANETIDKGLSINQSINFQNIQVTHAAQPQGKKKIKNGQKI